MGTVDAINSNTNVQNVYKDCKVEYTQNAENERTELLEARLQEAADDNGIFKEGWNNLKETLHFGSNEDKCTEAIEDYKNGKITFEEASKKIEDYDRKQDTSLDVIGNIGASIAAIAVGTALTAVTCGAAAPLAGAIIAGAVTKAGLKTVDRATNEVDGDAADMKQIAKDSLSGAVTGGTAFVTAGTGASSFAAGGAKGCAVGSIKTGLKTGAVSGGSNYLIDCAFEDDQDFNAGDFVKTTAFGSLVGGAVGGIMGGTNGVLRYNGVLQAADTNVVSNCASTAGYKITNARIRAALS